MNRRKIDGDELYDHWLFVTFIAQAAFCVDGIHLVVGAATVAKLSQMPVHHLVKTPASFEKILLLPYQH